MLVNTKYGKIEGITEGECLVFKGVPFAQPPIGENRFKKPLPLKPWEGIYKADKYSAHAMQGPKRGGFYDKEFYSDPRFDTPESEDCLYLNIWIPKGRCKTGENLPVAVYVHGGAFLGGAGSNLPFVCSRICERGIIIVTINYRLGALGFLCHPLIRAEGENAAGGNFGLWDQLEAFKWVKENIREFGGDSSNITVFGQSAGAMSLQALALTEQMQGLCNKMILQSGGGYKNPLGKLRTIKEAQEIGELFFEELEIDTKRCMTDKSYEKNALKKLYTIPEDLLMMKVGKVIGRSFNEKKCMPFVPVIDGELFKESMDMLMDKGKQLKIPYILGCNGDDLTTEAISEKAPENNPMHLANIEYAKRTGGYVYYFDRKLPGDEAGAFHSAELWYVFGSLDYCWRPFEKSDYELSDKIITYWTNFMKSGNPNEPYGGEDVWEECGKTGNYITFK
ncbi:para-nitrobenzyl esterase [Butyrivibrio sp. INlla18]|uniref:carboxylesterase/lipase family protein n=1 Tax=Butyrivibrio sp. INlla18 TaxID=1520806 RepID=UPI0008860C50|nr:carboxylesterase family protein [Butyrivibrio sp. INlla18]SDA38843.1 para-nitrobenzyl esterase [Butyrivibrio sp. INlla18]